MSLSRRLFLAVVASAGLSVLAGCATPIAPTRGEIGGLDLTYSQPTSRLEQLVYADIIARFGNAARYDAPLVTIRVSQANRPLGGNRRQVVLTGAITVQRDLGINFETIFSGRREGVAAFTVTGNATTDRLAEAQAAEQAAHALADAVLLTLSSELADPGR